MLVKYIEKLDNKKFKVTMEDGNSFPLYKSEIKKYSIETDADMEDETYDYIIKELLYKRGRERALYILKSSDKTEKQLRDKLAVGGYPSAVIDRIIEFLKKYGYVDDYGYTVSFVKTYAESMSIKMIKYKLMQKGIGRDMIDCAFDECISSDDYSQEKLILEIIRKRNFDYESSDIKEKNKMISHLMRKGFKYDDIVEGIKKSYKNV